MSNEPVRAPRGQWTEPAVTDLPPLTDLTLQTGGGIPDVAGSLSLRAALRNSLGGAPRNDR